VASNGKYVGDAELLAPKSPACPTCGNRSADRHELQLHREGLDTLWLETDPARPDELVECWHCERCQPHQAQIVMCALCSNTVMVGGDLAATAAGQPFRAPDGVVRWLTGHGWVEGRGVWLCGIHSTQP
jgi:hypothetical protein